MKFLSRSKFFNYHLPLMLSAIVLIVTAGIYINTQSTPKVAEAAWYSSSWQYRKPITIDHNKLSTTATSTFGSFPLLFSVTDSQLKSTGNGGLVASSSGADILFTDSDGVTKLDHEIENYASTTGQLIAWVRIPLLTATSDYTVYIYFGNASATNQQNATGVWDSDYKMVLHLGNGTTLSGSDSTSNGNNGTLDNSPTAVSAIVGGGASFNGTNQDIGITNVTIPTSAGTVSMWWQPKSNPSNTSNIAFVSRFSGSFFDLYPFNDGNIYAGWDSGGSDKRVVYSSASIRQGTWYYLSLTWTNGGTTELRINGTSVGTTSGLNATWNTSSNTSYIAKDSSTIAFSVIGADELELSDIVRSADWIATEYNNQISPSTFYAYGKLGISQPSAATGTSAAGAAWYNSSWQYRKPITIDHNKLSAIATTTYSSFTVLVSVTDSDLKSTGNGGKVASSTGADILFTDSDGISLLNYEIESYASTTGQLIAWAKIPTLTTGSDHAIYEYFGNANAPNNQSPATTWDGNYQAVYHLGNGTTLSAKDSLNTFNGTINGATATAGQIDGAANFVAGSSQNITGGPTTAFAAFTACVWFKSTTDSGGQRILDKNFSAGFWVGENAAGGIDSWGGGVEQGTSPFGIYITLPHGQWHMLCNERSGTAQTITGDGSFTNSTTTSSSGMSGEVMYMGSNDSGTPGNYFTGQIDEVEISNIARSADWIATEYNNQYSPATFYAYSGLQVQTRSGAGEGLTSHGVAGSWYSSSWAYRKPITIDHTKLSTTATSTFGSFPLLFSVTDSQLKSTGNGGLVASSSGADILFTDSDGVTKLDHEIESYASTTGQLIAWVRIPLLTSSADYPIYIYFGNSSATNQQNPSGVWDSSYVGVWHLSDNAANKNVADSTTNNNLGTAAANTSTKTATGQIASALNFASASTDNVAVPDSVSLRTANTLTLEMWVKLVATNVRYNLVSNANATGGYALEVSTTLAGAVYAIATQQASLCNTPGSLFTAGVWAHVVFTRNGTGSTFAIYVNGVSQTLTVTATSNFSALTTGTEFGLRPGNFNPFNGAMDEARISNIARGADWIATEYNNQNSPSTFYAYAGLQSLTRQSSSGSSTSAVKIKGMVRFR